MKKKLLVLFSLLALAVPASSAFGRESRLVIPSASCVSNLNPLLESYKEGAVMLNPLYDPLYVKDVDETRFYLAQSYQVSEDGTAVELTLKEGLTWHDGEAITADDLIFTLDVNADTNNGAGNTNAVILGDQLVSYRKKGPLTVEITLPFPSASYPDLLGQVRLIPAHVFGGDTKIVGSPANLSGVGSGPYKLREFRQDQYLALEKYDGYYRGAPSIEEIIFRIIPNSSAQEVALRNGEIQFMELSNSLAVQRFSEDPNFSVITYPEGRTNYLAVNKFCPTFSDPRVVEAIFAALNREEIILGAYGEDMAEPANSVLSNQNTFYDSHCEGYSQDRDKAAALVEELGLKGKRMRLYFNSERIYMKESAQIIQQQFRAVGIDLEVLPLESAGFFQKVFGTDGDYEFYLNGYAAVGDPDRVVAGMLDGTWGCNLKVSDEALQLWNKARQVFSDEERGQIYKEIQRLTNQERSCYPIAYPNYIFAVPSWLKGADAIRRTPIFEDYTKLFIDQ